MANLSFMSLSTISMLKRDRKRRGEVQIEVRGAIATTTSDHWLNSHKIGDLRVRKLPRFSPEGRQGD